jgi:hypothetical protein
MKEEEKLLARKRKAKHILLLCSAHTTYKDL